MVKQLDIIPVIGQLTLDNTAMVAGKKEGDE